jgi:hypothetical protein
MARRIKPVARRPSSRRTIPYTSPAPYKGLNTVDALAAMDPAYALQCVNFIATPQGLGIRRGYRTYVTGFTAAPTTLMPYNATISANSKFFAVAGTGIYDVTTPGAVGAPVVTGLNASYPYWQFTSQTATTAGKSFLVCVNGADFPRVYDGTTWTTCSQVATPSAPGQFSTLDQNGAAVSISNFVDVLLHQQRLWFVPNNSTKAYYCDIAQAGGQLYAFDFGPFFPRGGKLWKLASWSVNTGSTQGVQSNLVVISDKGDVLLYQGNNPGVAASWGLLAVYTLAPPVSRRCTLPFESDMLYLSRDGLFPLSKYLQTSSLNTTVAITNAIAPTISDITNTAAGYSGWDLVLDPGSNLMLLNVPQSVAGNNFQFCFNTITNGWTQFTGWPANCWGLDNNGLYFGGTDNNGLYFVALAFIGFADGANFAGAGGNSIVASALTAFTFMGDRPGLGAGTLKHVKLIKPYLATGAAHPQISVGINTDFNLTTVAGTASLTPGTVGVFDTSTWDSLNAIWGGGLTTSSQWITPVGNPGDALAISISLSATADTLWTATEWIIEPVGQMG